MKGVALSIFRNGLDFGLVDLGAWDVGPALGFWGRSCWLGDHVGVEMCEVRYVSIYIWTIDD